MGLSLRNLTNKIGNVVSGVERQINPFDNGATYSNPAPQGPKPPSFVQQAANAPVLGSILRTDQRIINPVNQGINDIQHPSQLYNPLINSVHNSILGSGIRLGAANVTDNPTARLNAKVALAQSFNKAAENAKNAAASGAIGEGGIEEPNIPKPKITLNGKDISPTPPKVAAKPANPNNPLGLPIIKGTSDQIEHNIAQMHEAARNVNPPNISPELKNLENRYEVPVPSTTQDQIMAQSTGVPTSQVTNERDIGNIKTDAERMALNHLSNGGTRDEAAGLYQKATGTTKKDALYQVQRVAKSADQSINVAKETPNPLLNQFKLKTPKVGEYLRAPTNRRAVENSLDLAEKRATAHEKILSTNDKANLEDYMQGTKDATQADNPAQVQAAMKDARTLYDTGHALGENFGKTKHIENFVPGYWDREADAGMDKLKANQAMEEEYGTQTWNSMSQEEKDQALAGYTQQPLGEEVNYGGLHAKGKVFKTKAEGVAAGYKPMFDNPFDAMRRYTMGAKLQLGDQAMIQGIRAAEPVAAGQRYAINLKGGGPVTVGKAGIKVLKNEGVKPPPGIIKKGFQGINSSAIKTIVANPVFHGANQEFNAIFQTAWRMPGNKVANIIKAVHNQAKFINDKAAYDSAKTEYYSKGGFTPAYGKDSYGFIAKGLQKAGIDPKHAELSPRAMASIEENVRISLYKTARDRGMNPEAAIEQINKTLGAPDIQGDMASSVGLFTHYLKTNVKLLGDIGVQATKGNMYPLIGAATGAAALYAANKGWQDITGNKNASVRAPGFAGTAVQLYKGIGQTKRGQIPTVITSHINPLITTGVEQATNRDLRKPVVGPNAATNSLSGPSGTGRLKSATSNLVGPGLTVQNLAGQKTSPAEAALGYGTGLYTPHAKGYQAAPNIPVLNRNGAKPGNGLDQQNKYFSARDKLLQTVYGDKRGTDLVNTYFDRNKTTDGKTIQLDPKESMLNAGQLYGNDKARSAVQQFEKSQSSHDPMWDRSPDQLKTFLNYKSMIKDSADQINLRNQNPWIFDVEAKQAGFYSKLPPSQSVKSPNTPTYPLSSNEANLMTQAASISDPATKSQFYIDHPELSQIDDKYGKYVNAVRAVQGAVPLPAPPKADAGTQSIINTYNALPQHDGPKGGSKTRAIWIQNNPDAYAKISNFYTQASLYSLVKEAAVDQLSGNAAGDQKLLKAAYSLGQYDIAKNKDGSYSLGSSYSSSSGSGSSSGYSKSSKSYTKYSSKSSSSSSGSGSHYVSRSAAKLGNPTSSSVDIDAGGKRGVAKLKKGPPKKSSVKLAQLSPKRSIAIKGKPTVSVKKSLV
jgi:hypothetical protein